MPRATLLPYSTGTFTTDLRTKTGPASGRSVDMWPSTGKKIATLPATIVRCEVARSCPHT